MVAAAVPTAAMAVAVAVAAALPLVAVSLLLVSPALPGLCSLPHLPRTMGTASPRETRARSAHWARPLYHVLGPGPGLGGRCAGCCWRERACQKVHWGLADAVGHLCAAVATDVLHQAVTVPVLVLGLLLLLKLMLAVLRLALLLLLLVLVLVVHGPCMHPVVRVGVPATSRVPHCSHLHGRALVLVTAPPPSGTRHPVCTPACTCPTVPP